MAKVIYSTPYRHLDDNDDNQVIYATLGNEWHNMRFPRPPLWARVRWLSFGFAMIFLFILWTYQGVKEPDYPVEILPEQTTNELKHTQMKSLGAKMTCDADLIAPSKTVPTNVNQIRPADVKVFGCLGDSITVAARSKNYEDDKEVYFVGNSLFSGGDESISSAATLGNILKSINPNLVGLSHGAGLDDRGFNVAVGGMTCENLPRQAKELVFKVKNHPKVNLQYDWKLVTIFIGTNDIRNLSCYKTLQQPHVPYEVYKSKLEETVTILQQGLPRTIVSILAIWNSQLTIEANSLIFDGKRKSCGNGTIEKRDAVLDSYRRAAYELQNEKKFNTDTFTVVTQSFLDEIKDAFRNKEGKYDTSFYGDDTFHLSKYGNDIFGKFLWNGLLEPVGKKTKKADLSNDEAPLICPDKGAPFIRTLGNS